MIQLVTDPDGFFRKVKRDGSLLGPLAVVAAAGVVGAVEQFLYGVRAASMGLTTYLAFVTNPLFLVVLWFLLTVLFYALSYPFSSGGGFVRTMKLVGWGFFPNALSNLLSLVVAATLSFGTGVTGPTVEVVSEKVAAISFYQVVGPTAFGLVFVLWSMLFWTFAIKHGRETSLSEAGAVVGVLVGVPVAGVLAFSLLSQFG